DVFPKNFESFFLGRPPAYLKEPSPALRVMIPHLEVVVFPTFQPDILPSPERFAIPDPLPAGVPRMFDKPPRELGNIEAAVRISANLLRWDVAVYGYRGFYRSPSLLPPDPTMPPQELRFHYPRLNTAGASAEGPLFGGLFGLEGAFYDSEDDRSGTDPFLPNSEVRGLAAFARPVWEDGSIAVQLYVQGILEDSVRWTVTLRFTQLLFNQTLQLSLFSFFGISDGDAYVIPSVRYAVTDALSAEI